MEYLPALILPFLNKSFTLIKLKLFFFLFYNNKFNSELLQNSDYLNVINISPSFLITYNIRLSKLFLFSYIYLLYYVPF